jgi:hypothetical protein
MNSNPDKLLITLLKGQKGLLKFLIGGPAQHEIKN